MELTTASEFPKTPFVINTLEDNVDVHTEPSAISSINRRIDKSIYTISMVKGKWGKLKSGGWIYLGNDKLYTVIGSIPFKVKVDITDLNIRTGAGTIYMKTGSCTGIGRFVITEVKEGPGSETGWGKLQSGAGWIALDYTTKI